MSTRDQGWGWALMHAPQARQHSPYAPRPQVVAYDISCPRRARRVRALLESFSAGRAQWSLVELQLSASERVDLLAAVRQETVVGEDRIANWQTGAAGRFDLVGTQQTPVRPLPFGARHWVLAYDIADGPRLRRFQRWVASQCCALQRSVYTFHGEGTALQKMTQAARGMLDAEVDRLSAWPLWRWDHLWLMGEAPCPLLAAAPGAHPPREQQS